VHSAHEAGLITILQAQAFDLSWLVRPGTALAALLTGMLGLQPQPSVAEALAYVLYLIPMLVFVLWPQRRPAAAPPAKSVQTGVPS
jgi:high-affinity iron transporter